MEEQNLLPRCEDNTDEECDHPFFQLSNETINYMLDLSINLEKIMLLLTNEADTINSELDAFLNKHGMMFNGDDTPIHDLPLNSLLDYYAIQHKVRTNNNATHATPNLFLVSLVSSYDTFWSKFIKLIFLEKPQLFNQIDKQYAIKDILNITLDELKEQTIDKEIDITMRSSHIKQLNAFQEYFGLDNIKSNIPHFKDFVEITERRNIIVHCNGCVSKQYLHICEQNGIDVSNINEGDRLNIDGDYFYNSVTILAELCIGLSGLIWRHVLNDKGHLLCIDCFYNTMLFNLLLRSEYHIVAFLSEYNSKNITVFSTDEYKRMHAINYAIAFYNIGCKECCKEVLERLSWKNIDEKYMLAYFVLTEDYEKASIAMKNCVMNSTLSQEEILIWPLFMHFRKTKRFKETYKTLYGAEEKIKK